VEGSLFDDGVERTTDSAVQNLRKAETDPRPGSGDRPEPNVRSEIEFKPAWVYITYTTKIEDENSGKS
jgi:hypothetical protein